MGLVKKQREGGSGRSAEARLLEVGCKKACHPPEQLARARAERESCSFGGTETRRLNRGDGETMTYPCLVIQCCVVREVMCASTIIGVVQDDELITKSAP